MANSDLLALWNDAVGNIGVKTSIAATTEQSAEAAACALRYRGVVEKIIRDFDWNCLRRRVALVEVSSGAVWPPSWAYMYEYPEDCFCIRGFDCGFPGIYPGMIPALAQLPYEIGDDADAGKVIMVNIPDPTLVYTSYAYDATLAPYEAKFDSSLKEAIGWALAAVIAGPLTGNASIIQQAKAEAVRSLAEAKAATANESAPNSMDAIPAESLAIRGYGDEQPWWTYPWFPRS